MTVTGRTGRIEDGPAYGDTPGWRRTGVTDRQAAGLDRGMPAVSVHADATDADDYRPLNGVGTYYETDAAW